MNITRLFNEEDLLKALKNAYKVGSAEADLIREWDLDARADRVANDMLDMMRNYYASREAEPGCSIGLSNIALHDEKASK
jgi:hypothetical protein